MVAFLLNIIFQAISAISHIITRVLFSTTAYVVVLLIHAFKVPGEATKSILEQAAETIKSVLEYALELIIEVISIIISSIFDAIKVGIIGFIVSGSSAVGELIDQTKTALEGLIIDDFPEIVKGFFEMISNVVSNLWNNYMEALGIVQENV